MEMKIGCTYRVNTYPLTKIVVADVKTVGEERFVLIKHLCGPGAGGFDLVRESSLDVVFCDCYDDGATGVISLLEEGAAISLGTARKVMSEEYGVSVLTHDKETFVARLRAFMK